MSSQTSNHLGTLSGGRYLCPDSQGWSKYPRQANWIGQILVVTAALSILNSSISPFSRTSLPLFKVWNMRRRTHVMDQRNGIMALPHPITSMHASLEPHQPCIECLSSHDSHTSGYALLHWSLGRRGEKKCRPSGRGISGVMTVWRWWSIAQPKCGGSTNPGDGRSRLQGVLVAAYGRDVAPLRMRRRWIHLMRP